MPRETSQEIDAAAAAWAARIDSGLLSNEEEKQLETWMAADDRRRGAFMRMRAVALHSERAKALGTSYDPEDFVVPSELPQPTVTRRRMLWMGGSAVAACAVVAAGLSVGMGAGATVYDTRRGEVRVITLEDGTVITLNTSSRIKVKYAKERRLVRLEEGEALFDVAKDKARPFIVEAGSTAVRAVGTSFTVKRIASKPVEILVREGVIEVTRPNSVKPMRMAANTRITAPESNAQLSPVAIAPEEVTREIAWKSGQIAFEGETLANAAEAFGRYSDTRIIIDDPAVGREEITGLFTANDPVSFARAAAASLELRAVVGPGEVRLSR